MSLQRFFYHKVGSLPMNYLGVPLDSFIKAYIVWNPFLEKIAEIVKMEKVILI